MLQRDPAEELNTFKVNKTKRFLEKNYIEAFYSTTLFHFLSKLMCFQGSTVICAFCIFKSFIVLVKYYESMPVPKRAMQR